MALEGDLSEFHLTDIIQLVDLSKKTGGVFLHGQRGSETLEGWLYFRDGKIAGARLGTLAPLEATYTFFTLASGPFRFHDDVIIDVPTITLSNEMIIMEGIMRQEAWETTQAQLPSLGMVPRLVTNPSATSNEINIEADEWRVLTMVNGRNTVGHIAQRSGLGEVRTCEIIARLLNNGLIEQRETDLVDALYPDLNRIVGDALGGSARGLLEDAYARAGIQDRATATQPQVLSALQAFEASASRVFGPNRVRQLLGDARALVDEVFSSRA
ncbi:MAG: DUF4388 domain-containing protein [Roseiflexaceae bacterium]|nr:DUF4388 domain-containing protein [Roseiflexaceae bacterium]